MNHVRILPIVKSGHRKGEGNQDTSISAHVKHCSSISPNHMVCILDFFFSPLMDRNQKGLKKMSSKISIKILQPAFVVTVPQSPNSYCILWGLYWPKKTPPSLYNTFVCAVSSSHIKTTSKLNNSIL